MTTKLIHSHSGSGPADEEQHRIWSLQKCCYKHQLEAMEHQKDHPKCLINIWCGTGKTRTYTIDNYINQKQLNKFMFIECRK